MMLLKPKDSSSQGGPWYGDMIPTPRGPGDSPPGPEQPGSVPRGGEPVSLVFQALEEIESLKRGIEALVKRLEALEHRVAALESPPA